MLQNTEDNELGLLGFSHISPSTIDNRASHFAPPAPPSQAKKSNRAYEDAVAGFLGKTLKHTVEF